MTRAFLSHSSNDKEQYVKIIAEKLGIHRAVYDALTFEEGMPTFDEIIKGLNISDLFVIFISDSALESTWVKTELNKVNHYIAQGKMQKFLPIICDSNVKYNDPRIPEWIREYNLKYISRPTIALKKN